MEVPDERHARRPAAFPSTRWSLVRVAGGGAGEAKRAAVGQIVERYAPALHAHVRARWRRAPESPEDLVQAFVAEKVLERDLLSRADQARGRFRSFLLASFDHFVSNRRRAARAAKRSPGHAVPLDAALAEAGGGAGGADPGRAFDVAWARQLLARAIDQMRDGCAAAGRPDVWGVFEARLLGPILHGRAPVPYDALVAAHGFASPAQASNVLVTANRTFVRALRDVVREYAADDDAAVDAEIEDLRRALGRAGGRR